MKTPLSILLLSASLGFTYPNCKGEVVTHEEYTLCYVEEHEQASWVSYTVDLNDINENASRKRSKFKPDPKVSTKSATHKDYRKSGYDRGHLSPAAVNKKSQKTMDESFYYSNMSPQKPRFNRGIWKKLEKQVRVWVKDGREPLLVVTGILLEASLSKIPNSRVSIPKFYYKAIADTSGVEKRGIAFIMPNEGTKKSLVSFMVSIDSLEKRIGYDLFSEIPDGVENKVESSITGWEFK